MAECAGHKRKEEAVFSIISLHLQVTCSVLSSAKLQRKVVMAQQVQSSVRLGTRFSQGGLSRKQNLAVSLPGPPFPVLCTGWLS